MKSVDKTKIRILIVDHNSLLLEGLRTLIDLQPDMDVAGVAATAGEAIHLFREHRPEVVLMDLDLPDSGGIRSVREICELDPAACVLGLLTHSWDERAALALRAGARSCITKDRLNRDLVTVIRSCLQTRE